jgi:hypothetical protein
MLIDVKLMGCLKNFDCRRVVLYMECPKPRHAIILYSRTGREGTFGKITQSIFLLLDASVKL